VSGSGHQGPLKPMRMVASMGTRKALGSWMATFLGSDQPTTELAGRQAGSEVSASAAGTEPHVAARRPVATSFFWSIGTFPGA
jgi:hypothetical protein